MTNAEDRPARPEDIDHLVLALWRVADAAFAAAKGIREAAERRAASRRAR